MTADPRETVSIVVGAELAIARPARRDFVEALSARLRRDVPDRGRGGRVVGVRTVDLLRVTGPAFLAPRGAVSLVREIADRLGLRVEWTAEVVGPALRAMRPAALGIDLRPYQREAVAEMHKRVQCLVKLPCGGGKTTIGAAAIVALGLPALVIAPTRDILDQWRRTLDEMGALRVFVIGGAGRARIPQSGDVALATPGALSGRKAALLSEVGVVVVDECHRALGPTWYDLLSRCPARYRWGLTATIGRSDKMEWALPYLFGEVVVPATTEELIAAGWLAQPVVLPVATGWAPSPEHRHPVVRCRGCGAECSLPPSILALGAPCPRWVEVDGRRRRCGTMLTEADGTGEIAPIDWSPVVRDLVRSAERNAVLLRLVEAAVEGGRLVLALLPSIVLTRQLADRLRQRGIDAESLSGEEGKIRRREILARLRSGKTRVVFATKVADEGLDIPELGCVINAEPGRSRGRTLQRAGRSMRPGGLAPFVVDLVDEGGELISQWMARRRSYADEYGREALASWSPVSVEDAVRLLAGKHSG